MIAVASRTRPDRTYQVRWQPTGLRSGVWTCTCTAAQCNRPCWHVAAVDELVRAYVARYWGESFEVAPDYHLSQFVKQYPAPIRQVVSVVA